MVLEEWDPTESVQPIMDPKPFSNLGTYSAPGPTTHLLLPEGATPWKWYKEYCWEEDQERWEYIGDFAKNLAITLSILFPLPAAIGAGAVAAQGWKSQIREKVRICHFVKFDTSGRRISEEDREVSREEIKPEFNPPGVPDNSFIQEALNLRDQVRERLRSNDTADQEVVDEFNRAKTKEEKLKVFEEAMKGTNNSEDEPALTMTDITLFAADIRPDDKVDFFLVPRVKANPAGGYFTEVGPIIHPGDVLSGKELRKYSFLSNSGFDPDKSYKLVTITPNERGWRYTKNYKLGRLPFSMVRVQVIEHQQ